VRLRWSRADQLAAATQTSYMYSEHIVVSVVLLLSCIRLSAAPVVSALVSVQVLAAQQPAECAGTCGAHKHGASLTSASVVPVVCIALTSLTAAFAVRVRARTADIVIGECPDMALTTRRAA
jgi:hypothetical protein